MPRAKRAFYPGLIWHVTHRCHKKEYLLRFAKDRRRWRHWLYVACRRHKLSVLNYIATSNHVHLLIVDAGNRAISRSLQLVASRTAQEFNRRKVRHGAFWEDRYHATAVQSGEHLARCMSYIDLNMVRAGAVSTPSEWDVCGFNEIQKPWQRKGIIDFDTLCRLMNMRDTQQLAAACANRAGEEIGRTARVPAWTESIGVGDATFLGGLRQRYGIESGQRRINGNSYMHWLAEDAHAYFPFSTLKTRIKDRKPPRLLD